MSTSDYAKLRKVWYAKLKKSGFDDIELNDNDLIEPSSLFTKPSKRPLQVIWEAKQAYYTMATRFLNDYKFKNSKERVIWEYHAEGISCRNISKILSKVYRKKKPGRMTVWRTIRRLQHSMKDMYMVSNHG